jgi:hypothetical protein
MAQEWSATTPDTRDFGQQIQRLLDDLNRPDMQSIAQFYLQDAARYFQRKPFFFSDIVNDRTPGWGQTSPTSAVLPNLFYPHGSTIVATASDNNQYAFVNLTGGTAGATIPTFTPILFTVPSNVTSPPHYTLGPGTTQDGGALWATVVPWPGQGVQFTQLCCIPFQNQYTPPLDYVAPRRIEVTWSGNLRIEMTKVSYGELRDYDVIRPTPPTTYPTFWAWFQQQIYLWPYPVGFYPITLSYRTGVPIPLQVTDSNFWTTQAEALVRAYAAYRIWKVVLQDDVAAASYQMLAAEELAAMTSQMVQQDQGGAGSGIPADVF